MTDRHDIVSAGDIMVECMLDLPRLPEPKSTVIVDSGRVNLGGPAINVAWHLSQLGQHPRLVGLYGLRDRPLVDQLFANSAVNLAGLIGGEGASDLLVGFITDEGHRSVYVRMPAPAATVERFSNECLSAYCLILNGSQHAALRAVYVQLVELFSPRITAFNPSYAIYTYEDELLAALIAAATLTILNERETQYACQRLGMNDAQALSQQTKGYLVTTREDKGAHIWKQGQGVHIPSVSGITGDVIGAGDAFFSGLLHEILSGRDPKAAGKFGAALAAFVVEDGNPRPAVKEHQVCDRLSERMSERY